MLQWLLWVELTLAVLLILLVILQPKTSGMGSMAGEDTSSFTTKRGAERVLHISTIVVAFCFALVAFAYHLVK